MNYVRKLLEGLKVRTSLYPQKGFGTFLFECRLQAFQISWSALQILQRTLSPQDHAPFWKNLTTCGKNTDIDLCAKPTQRFSVLLHCKEKQHTWELAKEYKMCPSCDGLSSCAVVCEAERARKQQRNSWSPTELRWKIKKIKKITEFSGSTQLPGDFCRSFSDESNFKSSSVPGGDVFERT